MSKLVRSNFNYIPFVAHTNQVHDYAMYFEHSNGIINESHFYQQINYSVKKESSSINTNLQNY